MRMDIISKIWPQWKTVELIGSGSFGKVYKARREELGNEYFSAIKIMRIPSDQSEIRDLQRSGMDAGSIHSYYEDMIRNLLNEIQIMESLKSANNIVGIEDHQVVKLEEGIGWEIYIRMELLTDLGSYLEQHTMSMDEIVQMGIDVCRALTACEKVNIIHRDIKIDNVFINEFGSFKLGDFGISKQLEKTQSAMSQKGTNMYIAPEVFRGEYYDKTVDTYSLGIMMYRLANDGRFPFMPPVTQPLQFNDTQRALEKRLAGEPMPEPHNADAELSKIIRKACEYSPEDRYQSAEELAKELQQYSYHKATAPSVSEESGSVHKTESLNVRKMEDERTYAAFSMPDSKPSSQKLFESEKQSHSGVPEWSLSGNPVVAAVLEVANGIDSDEKEVVKQAEIDSDSLMGAKIKQESELEKTMTAIPEPITPKLVKEASTQAKPMPMFVRIFARIQLGCLALCILGALVPVLVTAFWSMIADIGGKGVSEESATAAPVSEEVYQGDEYIDAEEDEMDENAEDKENVNVTGNITEVSVSEERSGGSYIYLYLNRDRDPLDDSGIWPTAEEYDSSCIIDPNGMTFSVQIPSGDYRVLLQSENVQGDEIISYASFTVPEVSSYDVGTICAEW